MLTATKFFLGNEMWRKMIKDNIAKGRLHFFKLNFPVYYTSLCICIHSVNKAGKFGE